jgi:predicted DNA-binding transcriptional regulator AlpA
MQSATINRSPREQLMTIAEAATMLNLNPVTLRRWAAAGQGPRHCRLNPKTIRYRPSDIEAFLHQTSSTSGQ